MSCVIRTLHQNGDRVLPSSSACGRQPGEHVGTAPGCGLRHGRMKCFIAGARLVVKNYMPFMTKILQNSLSPFPSEPAATVLSIALVSRHGVGKHPFNGARGAAPCRHPRLAWAMGPRADVLCAVTWALAWFIVGALSTDGTLGISALNVTGAFVTDVKS